MLMHATTHTQRHNSKRCTNSNAMLPFSLIPPPSPSSISSLPPSTAPHHLPPPQLSTSILSSYSTLTSHSLPLFLFLSHLPFKVCIFALLPFFTSNFTIRCCLPSFLNVLFVPPHLSVFSLTLFPLVLESQLLEEN